MNKPELKRLIWRCYLEQQFAMLTALLPVAYLLTLVMGLEDKLALRVILTNVTFNTPVWGFVVTYVMIRTLVTNAVEERRTDRPGDRLRRILKAPRKMEIGIMVAYQGACVVWATWPTLVYNLNPWIIPESVLAFGLLAQVVGIRMSVRMERVLRPVAIEEMHKYPQLVIDDERGFLWPKQRWFLPYSFAIIVFATMVTTAMIVVKKTSSGFAALFAELDRVAPAALSLVQVRVDAIFASIVWPVVGIGGFMTLVAAWCAWEIARHQNEGSVAVQRSIGSIASGQPALPEWVSTDEVGDLSMATSSAFERLRTFASSLGDSAQTLGATAGRLNSSRQEQTEALSAQAAALQETQVTAQEIKQTSMVAAQKAEDVLQHAERADKIGRAGETALEESLEGMKAIQQRVTQMAQSIRSLDERAQQVANITATVKSLADRSNMLALNAAIEAVRSGEHGKGFSVVAREIRSLADQSIKATHNVQTILQDLSESIRTTAQMSESGLTQVQGSVQQLRSFGESIRQMSGIVRDNVSSVRQISAAVNQQNQGIGQIFQAVNDLTRIMDQTLESVRTGEEAADHLRVVASRVTSFVEEYDFKEAAPASS